MESKRAQRIMATLVAPAFIRCSASISSVIAKAYCFALAMFTVLIGGKRFWNRLLRDTRTGRTGNIFVVMLLSLSLRFMIIWKKTVICMLSGYLQTKYFRIRFDTC